MRLSIGRARAIAIATAALSALTAPLLSAPTAHADTTDVLQSQFSAAADEFGVPRNVLLAVSYNESRWENNQFAPSEEGGYGPMQLTDVQTTAQGANAPDTPALHTALAAARLLHTSAAAVESDQATNIRAGAAVLSSYAKGLGDPSVYDAASWYPAVAAYAGATYINDAKAFADDVYATIRTGASSVTQDGERVDLAAQPQVNGNTAGLSALPLPNANNPAAAASRSDAPQCPIDLQCGTIQTAYYLWGGPNDLGNYCNYDTANRPASSFIKFIVIHDTEGSYDGVKRLPPDPNYCTSFQYLVRSADGHVDQALDDKNIGWQAGNWWINTHSVGIEQEGWASRGARWYTEKLYHSTARLVAYLAAKYDVPLDRAHIIGHDNVPAGGSNPATMHWDPGPYWDWNHFMALAGAPIVPTGTPSSNVVTIKPNFNTNLVTLSGCVPTNEPVDGGVCGTSPAQPSSAVQLHTAPSADAPLLSDPYIHPSRSAGTNDYSDVGAVAPTGAQYVVAARQGDWTAIWYEGQQAWFYNPDDSNVVAASGSLVSAKAGPAKVWGVAFPKPSELPPGPSSWETRNYYLGSLTKYSIPAGQSYVLLDTFKSDIFYAAYYDESALGDRTDFFGADTYYEIWYNHRIAFVNANDVLVSPSQ